MFNLASAALGACWYSESGVGILLLSFSGGRHSDSYREKFWPAAGAGAEVESVFEDAEASSEEAETFMTRAGGAAVGAAGAGAAAATTGAPATTRAGMVGWAGVKFSSPAMAIEIFAGSPTGTGGSGDPSGPAAKVVPAV